MDLTPEERTVLAGLCARMGGHQFDLSELITPGPDGMTVDIRAHDEDSLPHVSCRRCGRVWLFVAEGETYEAAEAALNAQAKAPRPLRAQRRADRLARQAKRAAAEQDRADAERAAVTPDLVPIGVAHEDAPAALPTAVSSRRAGHDG